MASKKAPSPAMEFLVSALKANRKASYADLKAKADEKKLKLFPIMYGRAQLLLGIVKGAKRGTGKFAGAKAAKAPGGAAPAKRGRPAGGAASKSDRIRGLLNSGMSVAEIAKKVGSTPNLVYVVKSKIGIGSKRGPGRPRSVASTTGLGGLTGILDAVKNTEREKAQLRTALERIQGILQTALG